MRIPLMRVFLLAPALTGIAPAALSAQIPVDCHAILATLEHNTKQVKLWSQVGRCGARGASALAAALGRERTSSDVEFWNEFGQVAFGIRHPELLQSALGVAADPAAAFPARALGLQIAIWHRNTNATFAHG